MELALDLKSDFFNVRKIKDVVLFSSEIRKHLTFDGPYMLNLNTDLASSYSLRRLFVRDSVMENLAPLINFKFFFVKKPDFKWIF